MGAYLSKPVLDKFSDDGNNHVLSYGASSMQGWRTSQEDAHSCILDFDENTSLFAVFDGHGGAEVARYSSIHLPNFLKSIEDYQKGNLKTALEEAFIGFDKILTDDNIINELKKLGCSEYASTSEEEDENEASLLRQEANIPIEDLIARYKERKGNLNKFCPHLEKEINRQDAKPLSPYLRAKQLVSEAEESGANKICSSSLTSSSIDSNPPCEPCSSSSHSLPNGEVSNSSPVMSALDGDSVSSSVNESIDDRNDNCTVSSTKCMEIKERIKYEESSSASNEAVTANCLNSSQEDTSLKKFNGVNMIQEKESDVSTSSEAKPIERNLNIDYCNDTSSTSVDEPTSSCKSKGKAKKIFSPKSKKLVNESDSDKPVYKAFLKDFESNDINESEDETDDFELTTTNIEESEDEVEECEDEDSSMDDEEEGEDDEDEEEEAEEDEEDEVDGSSLISSLSQRPGHDSGCTAVIALLRNNELYVANAGDSRCVISREGQAVDMSIDHKPEDECEKERIRKAGGTVSNDGRVNGGLNLSRAIGDHAYKKNRMLCLKDQMITAFPDIKQVKLEPEKDEFMVLACDGIWNSMTSQQVVNFISERIDEKENLSTICEELFEHCLSPNTYGDGTGCDNMTCVIVKFCNIPSMKNEKEGENDPKKEIEETTKEEEDNSHQPKIKRLKTND